MNAPHPLLSSALAQNPGMQGLADRHVELQGLRYPLTVDLGAGQVVNTVASFTLSFGVPATQKESYMTCFLDWLDAHRGQVISTSNFMNLFERLVQGLDASCGRLRMAFNCMLPNAATSQASVPWMEYDAEWVVEQQEGKKPVLKSLHQPAPSAYHA
jgi:GTP cyclohydrolase FolE2